MVVVTGLLLFKLNSFTNILYMHFFPGGHLEVCNGLNNDSSELSEICFFAYGFACLFKKHRSLRFSIWTPWCVSGLKNKMSSRLIKQTKRLTVYLSLYFIHLTSQIPRRESKNTANPFQNPQSRSSPDVKAEWPLEPDADGRDAVGLLRVPCLWVPCTLGPGRCQRRSSPLRAAPSSLLQLLTPSFAAPASSTLSCSDVIAEPVQRVDQSFQWRQRELLSSKTTHSC